MKSKYWFLFVILTIIPAGVLVSIEAMLNTANNISIVGYAGIGITLFSIALFGKAIGVMIDEKRKVKKIE